MIPEVDFKLGRMKQRLQYKQAACAEEQQEHPVGDVEHIASDPSMPGGNCDVNVQGASKKKKKNRGNLFNRSSPMKITRVCKGMTLDQKSVIVNADFGSMLGMKISKLIPELCRFLMGCFNPITCELDFGDMGKIPINTESVVKVMGVPEGSTPVPYHRDSDATRVVLQMLGIEGKQPSLTMIEKKLGRSEPADDVYLVKFMIFLVSSLFAPTTGIVVSPKCYPSLINTADIKNLEWATFIIDVIIQTANAKNNKNWFKACMPYLMVLYVDSLETDALDVPIDGTRICIWTNKMVRLIADLDTNSDGTFGKLPLKHCYRNKISLFSADPSAVDTFIKWHAPRERNEKDIAKYRGAVIEMCAVFEEGLAQFIKSLSSEAAKDIEPEQADTVLNADKPKTRQTRRRTKAAVKVPVADEEVALVDEEVPIADDKVAVEDEEVPVADDKVAFADEEVPVADVKVQGVLSIAEEEMVISVPESKENKRKISDEVFDHEGACKKVYIDAQQATEEGNVCAKDTITNRSASSLENKEPYPEMSHDLRSPVNPLKLLLCYGSGSQSSDSTVQNALVTSHRQADTPSSILKKQLGGRKKSLSFATDGRKECGSPIVQTSPAVRRPLTRSMSPKKTPSVQKECAPLMENIEMDAEPTKPYPSSRRLARVSVAEAAEECNKGVLPVKNLVGLQVNNSMRRRLEPDFLAAENQIETEQQRKLRELMDDCPNFDLGFDETTTKGTECTTKEKEPVASMDEIVIISSTEDSGDSLDNIYATIEMPSTAASSEKCSHTTV